MAPVIRGNSLYTIVDGPSWTQAEANSVKLGGHLVSLSTKEEDLFIWDAFKSNYWIGLTDQASPGNWKWINGDTSTYANWAPGNPNNAGGDQHYAWYWNDSPGKWDDNINNSTIPGKGIAETPFVQRGNSAYVIVQGPTWEEAEANAVKLGGHLVTVNDAAESTWLGNEFSQSKYQYSDDNSWWAPNEWSINHFWTGGKRVNNQWGWVSGESFDQSLYSLYLNNSQDSESNRLLGIFNNPNASANIYLDDSRDTYPVNPSTRLLGIAEIKLSTPTPTYTLTPSASSVNEGSAFTTSVSTTDVASGTTLCYSLSGTGINTSDFSSGALTGSGTVSSSGSFSFSHTLANDLTTEGTETLNIKLFSDSSRSTQVGSTATVSIADTSVTALPTYSVSTTASSINEGDGFSTTLTTTGVAAGTTYYWVRSGSGITSTDFIYGGLSGSGSIGSDGRFSYTHLTSNDLTTEGDEYVEFRIFSDSNRSQQVGSTASILIRDTSITPVVSGVTVNGNNSGIANSGTINNNGTINTGTQTTNSNNTTTNTTNNTNNNINNFFTYYTNTTNNTNSNNTVTNTNSNNTLTTWNIYRVDNSVKAGDIVNQWFGTAAPATTQLQDISETKLMDVVASTWSDKVQINRVVKASDAGEKLEAKQIDYAAGEVAGSVVSGGKGNDDIKGFAGWDNLEGGDGNDLLHGGNGRDIISGGAGRDELHGDFGWNTYKSEKDGVSDLIAIKSDQFLVNWLYGKAGNSPNGEKADIIEGLDSIDKIKIIGIDTKELTFVANITAKGVTGIGIYGKGILEALYTGGDLSINQITQMTSGDASAAAMSNSVNSYGVW